jgi:hypothetical protein
VGEDVDVFLKDRLKRGGVDDRSPNDPSAGLEILLPLLSASVILCY